MKSSRALNLILIDLIRNIKHVIFKFKIWNHLNLRQYYLIIIYVLETMRNEFQLDLLYTNILAHSDYPSRDNVVTVCIAAMSVQREICSNSC